MNGLLVATSDLPAVLRRGLDEAGGALAREREWWDPGAGPPQSDAPGLIVAFLPPGRRRVPVAVAEVAEQRYPGTPLLLLCAEPLTQPLVELQDGLVALVGPPPAGPELAVRLAQLLARPAPAWRRQERHLGAIRAGVRSRADGSPGAACAWTVATGRGLAVVVAAGAARAATPALLAALERGDDLVRTMAQAVAGGAEAGDCALIHLDYGERAWLAAWRGDAAVRLAAPGRMPAWSPLGPAGLVRATPALSGEVAVAAAPATALASPATGDAAGILTVLERTSDSVAAMAAMEVLW
jgi:hypothetical protein